MYVQVLGNLLLVNLQVQILLQLPKKKLAPHCHLHLILFPTSRNRHRVFCSACSFWLPQDVVSAAVLRASSKAFRAGLVSSARTNQHVKCTSTSQHAMRYIRTAQGGRFFENRGVCVNSFLFSFFFFPFLLSSFCGICDFQEGDIKILPPRA